MDPRPRVLWSTVAYFSFTAGWASMGYFLWVPGHDLPCLVVLMVLACTVAGNGALVGASRPLTIVSYGSYGLALFLTPLQSGGIVYNGISLLAVLYVGYMLFMSRQIYLTARDMLLLRYEKNDLIEALARSKEDSDRAREHAEAASRAKSQFLANMSHELRTPLNAILGFSEMITSRVFEKAPEKQYEYAGLIHSSGHHLLTLINDILDLAKIESGSWALREKDVDLGALIADACTMVEPKATAGGCELVTEVDADLPLVVCDERAMMQMLLNLTSNAVKFTPPGGRITVFARLRRERRDLPRRRRHRRRHRRGRSGTRLREFRPGPPRRGDRGQGHRPGSCHRQRPDRCPWRARNARKQSRRRHHGDHPPAGQPREHATRR